MSVYDGPLFARTSQHFLRRQHLQHNLRPSVSLALPISLPLPLHLPLPVTNGRLLSLAVDLPIRTLRSYNSARLYAHTKLQILEDAAWSDRDSSDFTRDCRHLPLRAQRALAYIHAGVGRDGDGLTLADVAVAERMAAYYFYKDQSQVLRERTRELEFGVGIMLTKRRWQNQASARAVLRQSVRSSFDDEDEDTISGWDDDDDMDEYDEDDNEEEDDGTEDWGGKNGEDGAMVVSTLRRSEHEEDSHVDSEGDLTLGHP